MEKLKVNLIIGLLFTALKVAEGGRTGGQGNKQLIIHQNKERANATETETDQAEGAGGGDGGAVRAVQGWRSQPALNCGLAWQQAANTQNDDG